MRSILICPVCSEKTEVVFEDWCSSLLPGAEPFKCKNPSCEKTKLKYHKLKGE